jgi:hypothetical protein
VKISEKIVMELHQEPSMGILIDETATAYFVFFCEVETLGDADGVAAVADGISGVAFEEGNGLADAPGVALGVTAILAG